jgi:trimeric autotransporter adhesin
MFQRAHLLPALCLALAITIGCGGEPPEKEMQQAQGALDAARAAGADKYATDEFAAATLALANAKEAVAQRDYRLALNHALDSRERAQNSAKMAADGKAAARTEADRAITAAQTVLNTAAVKLKTAQAAKVAPRLLAGPQQQIETARSALQEARAAFDRGDYFDVPAKASAATASLPAVSEELDAAMSPPARRRR